MDESFYDEEEQRLEEEERILKDAFGDSSYSEYVDTDTVESSDSEFGIRNQKKKRKHRKNEGQSISKRRKNGTGNNTADKNATEQRTDDVLEREINSTPSTEAIGKYLNVTC